MKKCLLIASAIIAIGFSSCDDKNKPGQVIDDISDKAKEVSKEAENKAEKVGDTLKKEGDQAKEKAKENF